MPKKHSYYKIAAYYAMKGVGRNIKYDDNQGKAFNDFAKRWKKRLDDLGAQIAKEPQNSEWRTLYQDQYNQLQPMVQAIENFQEASRQLYSEVYHVTVPTTAAKKAALEKAADAASDFDIAYHNYMEAHPYAVRDFGPGLEFDRMWNEENFDAAGDDLLQLTGYDDPKYDRDYIPEAPDPAANILGYVPKAPVKPVPMFAEEPDKEPVRKQRVQVEELPNSYRNALPMGTSVHQLIAQLAVGISPEAKAIGDAALLVNFHRSLYDQYKNYDEQRKNALQAGEDTSALDQKMGIVSSLYNSIQQTLDSAHKVKIAALSPELDANAARQAFNEGAGAGITMAHQFKAFKTICKDDLKNFAGYREFNGFWDAGMKAMQDGDKIMAALGLKASDKDRQTLQNEIREDHTVWPKVIKQEDFSKKPRFDQDAYLRLTRLMSSSAMFAQDRNVKDTLSSTGRNLISLLDGRKKEPYYEKQLLRNAASLPQIMKDNYEFLKQKANEDPEYGENRFNEDLKKLSSYLGVDFSELHLPEAVAEAPVPRNSWKGKIRDIKQDKDISLEDASEQLAKLLVCSVNESKNVPYSVNRMNKDIREFQETKMFKQIAKNPDRCIKLLKEGNPTDIVNGMMHPFQNAGQDEKRKALEKLKIYKDSGFLFPTKGRSAEWKNFYNSIDDIDLSKPETFDRQLETVFNTNEAYMKGKKAESKDIEKNERVKECMDVMQIISGVSPYVKDRVNQLVDRTNEVRTRWGRRQPTFDMDDFGSLEYQAVNKLHGMVEEAREYPEKMEALKNEPKYNKQSIVHPEMDRADYGWEIVNKPEAQQQNDAPQANA